MTKEALRDPMQELVDKYAGEAEQRDAQKEEAVVAVKQNTTKLEKDTNTTAKQVGPKKHPEPSTPTPTQPELEKSAADKILEAKKIQHKIIAKNKARQSDEDNSLSEEEVQKAMEEAIAKKKEARMQKIIDKGASIAKEQQNTIISHIADSSKKQKGASAKDKIALAVVETAKTQDEEDDKQEPLSKDTQEAVSQIFGDSQPTAPDPEQS